MNQKLFAYIYRIPLKNLVKLSYRFFKTFDSHFYRKNADSRFALIFPRFHFVFFGQKKLAPPNQTFDPAEYVNSNPHTNAIQNYPFFHFLLFTTKKTIESYRKILITSTSVPLDLDLEKVMNLEIHVSNCHRTLMLHSSLIRQFNNIKVITHKDCHVHSDELENDDVDVRQTNFQFLEIVAHRPLVISLDFIINLFLTEEDHSRRESQIVAMISQLASRSVYVPALLTRVHSSFFTSYSDLRGTLDKTINLRLNSYVSEISHNEKFKKLLLVSHDDSHTGAPLFLKQLAEQLISAGYMVHVLTLKRHKHGRVFSSLNENHSYLENYTTKLNRRRRVSHNWLLTKNGKKLLRKGIRSIDPDLLLANSLCSGSSIEVAQKENIPTILYVHEAWAYNSRDFSYSPVLSMFKEFMEASNLVLFGSINTRLHWEKGNFAINSFTIPTYRHIELPPQEDVRLLREKMRAKLNIDSNVKVFLSVSTFEPRKRIQDIILAFQLLSNLDTHLILVGSTQSLTQVEILSLIRANDRITVFDTTHDLNGFYAAADCFVFASEEETMPLVLQEAALHRLPRISATYPGSSELIPSSKFAYLFAPRDVNQLTARMNEYLESPYVAQEKTQYSYQLQKQLSHDGVFEFVRAMKLITNFRSSVIPSEWLNEEN